MNNYENNYYVKNWDNYWQSYAKLNPDLASNGIKGRRALLNHYIKCGINENRRVSEECIKATVQEHTKATIQEHVKATIKPIAEECFKEDSKVTLETVSNIIPLPIANPLTIANIIPYEQSFILTEDMFIEKL